MIALLTLLCLLQGPASLDAAATEAYRAKDYATASALWEDALASAAGRLERGRLLYNLGNAAFRDGETLRAVAWYTAALRLTPRDADLWANLELARNAAGLDPADRGDLADTTRRLLSAPSRGEAQWLLLAAQALWGVFLGGEALRGGLLWRRLAWIGLLGVLAASTPLVWQWADGGGRPVMVVKEGGTQGRSEPRADAKGLARVRAGEVVEWRDALSGWVKVEDEDGRELWVREGAVFELARD